MDRLYLLVIEVYVLGEADFYRLGVADLVRFVELS